MSPIRRQRRHRDCRPRSRWPGARRAAARCGRGQPADPAHDRPGGHTVGLLPGEGGVAHHGYLGVGDPALLSSSKIARGSGSGSRPPRRPRRSPRRSWGSVRAVPPSAVQQPCWARPGVEIASSCSLLRSPTTSTWRRRSARRCGSASPSPVRMSTRWSCCSARPTRDGTPSPPSSPPAVVCAERPPATTRVRARLEAAGLRVVQLDAPALRELLPLRAAHRPDLRGLAGGCVPACHWGRRELGAGAHAPVLLRVRRRRRGDRRARRRRHDCGGGPGEDGGARVPRPRHAARSGPGCTTCTPHRCPTPRCANTPSPGRSP
jgi:hypothetical protein